MRVTVLIDNMPGRTDLVAGHGLSLGISLPDVSILFDAGPSSDIVRNSEALGFDLASVGAAVLSHGHYDHGGGLGAFMTANHEAPLFLMRGADNEFYAEREGRSMYIGLDRETFNVYRGRMVWVDASREIFPKVHLISGFPDMFGRPLGNSFLKAKVGTELRPDAFAHELAMVVKEQAGITVFTGCGHSGVLNIVQKARSIFPEERLQAVVGGFHQIISPTAGGLSGTEAEVRDLGRQLMRWGCGHVYGGHCTGEIASRILKDELGDKYDMLRTGMEFDI